MWCNVYCVRIDYPLALSGDEMQGILQAEFVIHVGIKDYLLLNFLFSGTMDDMFYLQ